MRHEIRQSLIALLSSDPSVTASALQLALAALDGKGMEDNGRSDRALSRREVARQLGCTPATVSRYAARGLIHRVTLGKHGLRASGYSASSIQGLFRK